MKRSFKQFLVETPIEDYKTYGDFNKSSSFRHATDRYLITNPKVIEHTKKKFGKTDNVFNFYFVNSPKANKHTEVGLVPFEWVRKNLGDEVADDVEKHKGSDAINVIYTNNKGSQRIPITAWALAHRLGHALEKEEGARPSYTQYREASNHLLSQLSQILELYNVRDFPVNHDKMGQRGGGYGSTNNRNKQLIMKNFFQHVGNFKSARDRKIRDWFEVLNEFIAQYLITGKITFRPAPKYFKVGTTSGYVTRDVDEVNASLETLGRDMAYMIDNILSSAVGSVFVM